MSQSSSTRFAVIAAIGVSLVSAFAWAGASQEVDQVGQKFTKPSLSIKAGDTLHFLNRDDTTHNINIIDADDVAVDKGLQKPGETIDVLFDKAGKFMARCAIHPRMKMSVAVE